MKVECPKCGEKHEENRIGYHWSMRCDPPSLDHRQEQIVTGLMMGDASATSNQQVVCGMTTEEFLEWVDDEMGLVSTGCRFYRSAEEVPMATKDIYRLTLRNIPDIQKFSYWYDSGQKRFPEDLELTPLIAKVWYACDGSLLGGQEGYPSFGVTNELDRSEFLIALMDGIGFESTVTGQSLMIYETEEFLDWMGDPVPGFEYKWKPVL